MAHDSLPTDDQNLGTMKLTCNFCRRRFAVVPDQIGSGRPIHCSHCGKPCGSIPDRTKQEVAPLPESSSPNPWKDIDDEAAVDDLPPEDYYRSDHAPRLRHRRRGNPAGLAVLVLVTVFMAIAVALCVNMLNENTKAKDRT